MNLIDVSVVLFVIIMTAMGRKNGFVKTVLGTVSVLVCGIATIVVYNILRKAGVVLALKDWIFSFADAGIIEEAVPSGPVDYVISGVCAVVILIGVKFAYKFLADVLSFVVPGFLNRLLGAVFGMAKGLAVVFCVLAVIYYISGSAGDVVKKIDETTLVSACYYNNPIVEIINKK